MSLRSRIAEWLAPQAAGSVPLPPPETYLHIPYIREAGVSVTAQTATQVSAVYGCCRLIVDSLAAAPVRVYEDQGAGKREIRHDDAVAWVLNYGADVSVFHDAPTAQAIEEALFWSALLTGNGYAEISRSGQGFAALWPLEPDSVTPKVSPSGVYYYEVRTPKGDLRPLDASRMFHLRGPSPHGAIGDSTVYQAAKAIGIAQASQVFSAAYFANGTVLSGALEFPGPGRLTPDQRSVVREDWKARHGGAAKSAGVAILDGGVKYVPLGHDAQKSQLVESRRFQVAEIARFFGVPTTLLADNEAWTNLSELYLGFYRNALLPWAERFDAEATRKLFPLRKPWREVQHDLTRLVMGSFKDQVTALRVAVDGGLKTRNEARSILGDNSIGPDGDVLVSASAVTPLRDVLSPPKPAPSPPPVDDDGEEMPEPALHRPSEVARVAVALDRFVRRMDARKAADGQRDPVERDRLLPGVVDEVRAAIKDESPGLSQRVGALCDAVLAGEPPHLAAERFCT